MNSEKHTGNILQEDSYYPYGMTMNGLDYRTRNIDKKNLYLFEGKELQDDFGLDWYAFEFRNYDPQLGRWHVPDPMVELHYEHTPYSFEYNNPINLIDPLGLDTLPAIVDPKTGEAYKLSECHF